MTPPRVLVIGAGAAGLMAARFAAAEGADVTVLEHTKDGGRKILISGGGRCNVLPGTFRPETYVTSSSANSLKRILRGWPLEEQRRFFEDELRIPLKHEPEFDKLFPVSDRARDVRDALVDAVHHAGGRFRFESTVADFGPGEDGGWWVETAGGARLECDRLIVATGGLSVAATGSDGRGLSIVTRLGHTRHPTHPALTPLLADPAVHAELAGVTLDVRLTAGTGKARRSWAGSFLFTHRGYSGPVVLNASHVVVRADPPSSVRLEASWVAESADVWEDRLVRGSGTVGSSLSATPLPERLARRLADEADVPWDRDLSQLRKDERRRLLDALTRYPLPVTGDEGYRKAEVTGGGVDLGEVDPESMESRIAPGLFLCGEILDAFGPIGGHNFLWAWTTGRAAGRGAARPPE